MKLKNLICLRLLPAVLALTTTGGWNAARVYAGSCCGGGSSASSHHASPVEAAPHHQTMPEPPFRAPHGGQLTKTLWNYFEVVYEELETRVYAYDMFRAPIRTARIQGQAIMHVRSSGGIFTYPLRYVPVSTGQDYLAVSVDLTRVVPGDMDVEFELHNLPNTAEPSAHVTQVFGAPAPAAAAVAPLVSQDHTFAAEPPVCRCQGSGEAPAHATHGPADTRVAGPSDRQIAPKRLPPLASPGGPSGVHSDHGQLPPVMVAPMTSADEAAIRAQGVCPVTKQPLGSHGTPTKLLINGRPLFVCCQGCIESVKANPELYLAMVAH